MYALEYKSALEIEAYQAMGPARLLAEGDLSERQLRLAVEYYREYPREIDAAIAENGRAETQWHALYPAIVPDPTVIRRSE